MEVGSKHESLHLKVVKNKKILAVKINFLETLISEVEIKRLSCVVGEIFNNRMLCYFV